MTSPGKLESKTPETDALTTAPVDPAVNYASAKLTNALNLCASLERRLRAATQPVGDGEVKSSIDYFRAITTAFGPDDGFHFEQQTWMTMHERMVRAASLIERLAREKEAAKTIAHRAEHRANQAETDRDNAHAELRALREQAEKDRELFANMARFINAYVAKADEMREEAGKNGIARVLHTHADAIEARRLVTAIDAARKGGK